MQEELKEKGQENEVVKQEQINDKEPLEKEQSIKERGEEKVKEEGQEVEGHFQSGTDGQEPIVINNRQGKLKEENQELKEELEEKIEDNEKDIGNGVKVEPMEEGEEEKKKKERPIEKDKGIEKKLARSRPKFPKNDRDQGMDMGF